MLHSASPVQWIGVTSISLEENVWLVSTWQHYSRYTNYMNICNTIGFRKHLHYAFLAQLVCISGVQPWPCSFTQCISIPRTQYLHITRQWCLDNEENTNILQVKVVITQALSYYIPRYHGNRRLRNLISARSPELLSWPVWYYQCCTGQQWSYSYHWETVNKSTNEFAAANWNKHVSKQRTSN